MKKIKHSKYKNTGFLFEILTRQVTVDTMEGVSESKALSLIKKYFNKGTELYKEYALYDALMKKKFVSEVRANDFIEKVIKLQERLNVKKLKTEKYNLVKEIKKHYSLDEMFSTQINEYKVLGSIYILFEGEGLNENTITHYDDCKNNLMEFMMKEGDYTSSTPTVSERYLKEDKEVRLLAYKLMIEKFNKKYSPLGKKQKSLLKEFINNVSNTNSLRTYINKEVDVVKETLENQIGKTSSDITKIKLNETIKMIDKIKKGNVVRNEQFKAMLHFYDLVDELEKVNG